MSYEMVRASDVDVNALTTVAKLLATSGYFEQAAQQDRAIAQMATKVLAGREMGFGPWASVGGIHVIQGKLAVGANLMAAAVKNSQRYDYKVRKMAADGCELEFFERNGTAWQSLGVSSFTIAEAKTAGVKNLDKFPRNMLFARAISNGVRWYCPDVFNGNTVYVPEELGANVDGEGNVIEVSQPAPSNGNGQHKEVAAPVTVDSSATGHSDGIDGDKARKRFHAVGVESFGKEWDAARKWLVIRYTTKNLPLRKSSSDLTPAELVDLADTIEKHNGKLVAQYDAWKVEQAKYAAHMAAESPAYYERKPEDNPFDSEPAQIPA